MQGVWVQSLVGKLRSGMLHIMAKKKKSIKFFIFVEINTTGLVNDLGVLELRIAGTGAPLFLK